MLADVTLLGTINRPLDGLPRWFYIYFVEYETGEVDTIESEDYLVNEAGEYKTGKVNLDIQEDEYVEDLLGSSAARPEGPRTEREICQYAARAWA